MLSEFKLFYLNILNCSHWNNLINSFEWIVFTEVFVDKHTIPWALYKVKLWVNRQDVESHNKVVIVTVLKRVPYLLILWIQIHKFYIQTHLFKFISRFGYFSHQTSASTLTCWNRSWTLFQSSVPQSFKQSSFSVIRSVCQISQNCITLEKNKEKNIPLVGFEWAKPLFLRRLRL